MIITGKTIFELDELPEPSSEDLVAVHNGNGTFNTANSNIGSEGIQSKGVFRNDEEAAEAVDGDGQPICAIGDWYELSQESTVGAAGILKRRIS